MMVWFVCCRPPQYYPCPLLVRVGGGGVEPGGGWGRAGLGTLLGPEGSRVSGVLWCLLRLCGPVGSWRVLVGVVFGC